MATPYETRMRTCIRKSVAGERPGQHPPESGRSFRILVAAETLLAAAMILPVLGVNSFWLDEAFTATYCSAPGQFWTDTVHWETNMCLYFGLAQLWSQLGQGEAWLRGLSALMAIGSIPAVAALGTRLFSPLAGLLSGLLLAINPFFLHYAREARSYALVMLLSILATLSFVRLVQTPCLRRGWHYGVTLLLGIFSHFFVALHGLSHAASLLAHPLRRWPWRALALALAVVLSGAILMFTFVGPRNPGIMSWLTKPTWQSVGAACSDIAGQSNVVTGFYALCLFTAVVFLLRRPDERWIWTLAVASVLVPLLVSLAYSWLRQPLFQSRYLASVAPALALCAGAVLSRMRPPALGGAIVLLVAMASVVPVRKELSAAPWEDWRALTEHVRSHGRAGDVLICHVRYLVTPVRAYEHMHGALPVTVLDLQPSMPPEASSQSAPPAEVFAELAGTYRRVWLVLGHNTFDHLGSREQTAKVKSELNRHFDEVESTRYRAIHLTLWTRR